MSIVIEEKPESVETGAIDDRIVLKSTTRDLTTKEVNTDQTARAALEKTDHPHPQDKLGIVGVTETSSDTNKIRKAARNAGIGNELKSRPDPTLGTILTGLSSQKKATSQSISDEKVEAPTDTSSITSTQGGKDEFELSEESLSLLEKLRGLGIHLLKEGTRTIKQEQLTQLKSEAETHIENYRAEEQLVSTQIETLLELNKKLPRLEGEANIAEEKKPDPNLTLMAIQAGLAYERKAMAQLASHEGKTKQNLDNIDTLLDLSSSTTNLGDKESYELSQEMQDLLAKLRGHGINLLKEGTKTISKEQLIQLKSEIGARVDKARTEVQQIFTKIQTLIQFMNSVNDTCKRITSEDSRSKNKFIENQKVR